jgi:hypothetical protein
MTSKAVLGESSRCDKTAGLRDRHDHFHHHFIPASLARPFIRYCCCIALTSLTIVLFCSSTSILVVVVEKEKVLGNAMSSVSKRVLWVVGEMVGKGGGGCCCVLEAAPGTTTDKPSTSCFASGLSR